MTVAKFDSNGLPPALGLLVALVFSGASCAKPPGDTVRSKVSPSSPPYTDPDATSGGFFKHAQGDRVLTCDFLNGPWTLHRGPKPGYPLYMSDGKRKTEITDLRQLKGRVTITSCRQALAYARLRTSPETYLSFSPLENEVLDRARLPSDLTFGDQPTMQAIVDYPYYGVFGMVSSVMLKRCKLPLATCKATGDSFIIRRVIIRESSKEPRAFAVTEAVGPDGLYRELDERPFTTAGSIPWIVPTWDDQIIMGYGSVDFG